jgi:integrase
VSISSRTTKRGRVYDVRLRTPDGRPYKRTFRTKKEAVDFEAAELARRGRGDWVDPTAGRVTVGEYATRWMSNRADLRPRTRELYSWLLHKHLLPTFAGYPVNKLRPADVRAWHSELLEAGTGPVTVAKAYRLLRTILQTAVADGLISKNPCAIRAAGVERSPERPTASVSEVHALVDATEDRYKLLVLLAAFCGLRLGELLALRRDRFDLELGVVRVVETQHELADRRIIVGPPKTDAGRRTVALPPHLVPVVQVHLNRLVAPAPDALVFTGEKGGWLRRAVWNAKWRAIRSRVGLPHLRFHDLRHTGNTLAAGTGASTRELMARLGHASPQAALRYQHATHDRDAEIAASLSALAERSLPADSARAATGSGCATDAPCTSRLDTERESAGSRTAANGSGCAINEPWVVGEPTISLPFAQFVGTILESGRRESNPRSQLGKLMFCL